MREEDLGADGEAVEAEDGEDGEGGVRGEGDGEEGAEGEGEGGQYQMGDGGLEVGGLAICRGMGPNGWEVFTFPAEAASLERSILKSVEASSSPPSLLIMWVEEDPTKLVYSIVVFRPRSGGMKVAIAIARTKQSIDRPFRIYMW